MPDTKTIAPEQFVAPTPTADGPAADFSSDAGALAYAHGQVDKLAAAMHYAIEKHVAGWPLDTRDRERNTYEALRHLLRNTSFAHAAFVEADYGNPTLTKMGGTNRIQFQLQSPDCNYHAAVLHGDYRYRLRGYRGTAAVFQVQMSAGHGCNPGKGFRMTGLANNFDTPGLEAGATIDLLLSRDKPAALALGEQWMALPEGRCELHLRQYYADWESEEPADLMLTCEDQIFPPPLLDRSRSEEHWERLTDLLQVHSDFYRMGVQGHLDADPHEIEEVAVPGAFAGVNYFFGHFRCGPDEAVIVEIDPVDCMYWNVAINQMQWEPGDYWARLISYTMAQARPEPDGRTRWIASWTDPGVPNWLDCSGRTLHLIAFRFFRASAKPARPRLKVVPLAELARHIPDGTPAVTPAERHALMTRRLASVYRRRFSDF